MPVSCASARMATVRRPPRFLVLACVAIALVSMTLSTVGPLLPHFKASMHSSLYAALVVAGHPAGSLLAAIPTLLLSRRFGLPRVIVAGALLMSLSSILFVLAGLGMVDRARPRRLRLQRDRRLAVGLRVGDHEHRASIVARARSGSSPVRRRPAASSARSLARSRRTSASGSAPRPRARCSSSARASAVCPRTSCCSVPTSLGCAARLGPVTASAARA